MKTESEQLKTLRKALRRARRQCSNLNGEVLRQHSLIRYMDQQMHDLRGKIAVMEGSLSKLRGFVQATQGRNVVASCIYPREKISSYTDIQLLEQRVIAASQLNMDTVLVSIEEKGLVVKFVAPVPPSPEPAIA